MERHQRIRASLTAALGDLYVVLKPYISPIAGRFGYAATHGSPWDL
jgi:hypothetical protein